MKIKGILRELLKTSKLENDRSNKNRFILMLDMIYCRFKYGMTIPNYRAFGLALIDKKHRKEFFSGHGFSKFLSKYDTGVTDDKYETYLAFKEYYHRDVVHLLHNTESEINDFIQKHQNFFAKRTLGYGGYDVRYIKQPSAEEILVLKKQGFYMFEEEIKQHPTISKLNSSSVNTLRIVTVKSPQEEVVVLPCLMRVGSGGKIDNVSSGGGAYLLIDEEGYAVVNGLYQENLSYINGIQHMVPLDLPCNFKIPYFKEAIEMCKEMMLKLDKAMIIGWDIAIGEEQPILVELNLHPDVIMNQNYYGTQCKNKPHSGVKRLILDTLEISEKI